MNGVEKIITAYMGLCSYFGNFRVQNKEDHLLGHVKDLGIRPKILLQEYMKQHMTNFS